MVGCSSLISEKSGTEFLIGLRPLTGAERATESNLIEHCLQKVEKVETPIFLTRQVMGKSHGCLGFLVDSFDGGPVSLGATLAVQQNAGMCSCAAGSTCTKRNGGPKATISF